VFPECYEILKEGFDDPETVSYVLAKFAGVDGLNYATSVETEALDWTRKIITTYGTNSPEAGFKYLTTKGNASDIELLNKYGDNRLAKILEERVAGMNLFGDPRVDSHGLGRFFIPSVANAGPQAIYVGEILFRVWEEAGMDISKIPTELLTMAVSFDKHGNPVCNVDLAKYGLSMPVISTEAGEHIAWQRKAYTVMFPDLDETIKTILHISRKREPRSQELDITYNLLPTNMIRITAPPTTNSPEPVVKQPDQETETPPPEQPTEPSANKTLTWLAVIALVVIAGIAVWKLTKRKR